MLERFYISGFKSYSVFEPDLLQLAPLTMLIGGNASGKSNFIEGIQLLTWLARGQRLGELAHAIRDGALTIRGRVQDFGSEHLVLACETDQLQLRVELAIDDKGPRVRGEAMSDRHDPDRTPLYVVTEPAQRLGSELPVAYKSFVRGLYPEIFCIDQQAVFTQLLTPARFHDRDERSQREIPEHCKHIADELGRVLFLDPVPGLMRGYSYLDELRLDSNGRNVSSILARICAGAERDTVLTFVQALPEQAIKQIDFLRGPRNDVMVQLVETFGGHDRAIDASLLSDGTLRVLAIAAAVLSVEPGSLVVIEEIDNGVHPSRAKTLMDALYATAKRRGIKLLATTHNPALLDAIPLAAVGDTVACYRDQNGESRLQRLADLDDFVELSAQGPLGILATSGALEKFLKQRRTPEERAAQLGETLDLFRAS